MGEPLFVALLPLFVSPYGRATVRSFATTIREP